MGKKVKLGEIWSHSHALPAVIVVRHNYLSLPAHPAYCACGATHASHALATLFVKCPVSSCVAIAPAPIGAELWTNWEPETRTHTKEPVCSGKCNSGSLDRPRSIECWRAGTKPCPGSFCAGCSRPFPMSCLCESFHHKHHKTNEPTCQTCPRYNDGYLSRPLLC
jgi:hypothetical protein